MPEQSFRRNFLQHAPPVRTWVQEHDPRTMGMELSWEIDARSIVREGAVGDVSMAIRFATVDDIPALVALGKRMHAITRFRTFAFDEERVAQALRAALEKGTQRYVCFVAEDGDKQIAGALLAVLERHIFSEQLTASVMHYDVLPERRMGGYGLRLMKAFEQWARNRAVAEISFGINSGEGFEQVGGFARRIGFAAVGENFVKEIR
jgi:GNAT superfamily N-acetyltransferase